MSKEKKYHVASEPQALPERTRRDATLYKIAQDISRISDVQGILALVFAFTLAAAIIYAIIKATSTEAMTAVIQILVPIVSAIVGFYFGKRTAEAA